MSAKIPTASIISLPLALRRIIERAYISNPSGTSMDLEWLRAEGFLKDEGALQTQLRTAEITNAFVALDQEDLEVALDNIGTRLAALRARYVK